MSELLTIAFDYNAVGTFFNDILLTLDAIIYTVVGYLFQIFLVLARINIFSDESIGVFLNNIYLILGVVMLFVVTYSLFKVLVNPDDLSKGETSPTKIAFNITKALIIIALVPAIFDFSKYLQNTIVDNNIIGAIILGEQISTADSAQSEDLTRAGYLLASDTFSSFLYPAIGDDGEPIPAEDISLAENGQGFEIVVDGERRTVNTFDQMKEVTLQNGDFFGYTLFAENQENGELVYLWFISTITGIFLLYVIFSFCLDLGIRAVKLGFLQLIAPIPAMSMIIPGQKKIFDSWLKLTITTYLEVFIRLIVIFFGMFLIAEIPFIMESLEIEQYEVSYGVAGFAKLAVILGIISFMKLAPKLITDLFGLDSGNMKLGIKDKLKAAGVLTAGSVVARGGRTLTGGFVGGAVSATRTGTLGGFVSGYGRGAAAGFNSKNIRQLPGGINTAINTTSTNHANREAYRARHGGRYYGPRVAEFFSGTSSYASQDRELATLGKYGSNISSIQDIINKDAGYISAHKKLGDAQLEHNLTLMMTDDEIRESSTYKELMEIESSKPTTSTVLSRTGEPLSSSIPRKTPEEILANAREKINEDSTFKLNRAKEVDDLAKVNALDSQKDRVDAAIRMLTTTVDKSPQSEEGNAIKNAINSSSNTTDKALAILKTKSTISSREQKIQEQQINEGYEKP